MRLSLLPALALAFSLTLTAQTPAAKPVAADPLASLDFLLGTWSATTSGGSAGAAVSGTYTFARDLNGHVLQRTGAPSNCKGPKDFDCLHHDQLTIFSEQGALVALYLDNEGHAIHYAINTPDAHTVVFLSTTPGPKFKLTYHLEGTGPKAVMSGKFQFAPRAATTSTPIWSGRAQSFRRQTERSPKAYTYVQLARLMSSQRLPL